MAFGKKGTMVPQSWLARPRKGAGAESKNEQAEGREAKGRIDGCGEARDGQMDCSFAATRAQEAAQHERSGTHKQRHNEEHSRKRHRRTE